MKTIGDLLSRDLGRKIEEIIKLGQTDEQSVYAELTEYVATDRIRDQYYELLRAMAEAPADPHEGIGVWVSGFFGSGKSSFAKNLGYVLANPQICGQSASDLFTQQVNDQRITDLVAYLNTRIPTEVIMFDVRVEHSVRRGSERLAEIMYASLLRHLDYAEDFDIAELEIELEGEGRLDAFVACCQETLNRDWRTVRKGAQKIARASTVLHHLDPVTYPTAETWSHSLQGEQRSITIGTFVERTFDLWIRRRPGKALAFIMDEVGQYVARSSDKIEDLRTVVEQFGRVGKTYVKARQMPAPVWIVVTSQEKLDEVVAALDSKKVRLATLQDRFKYRFDMAPADIREVATRRVLSKKDEAQPILQQLYQSTQGQLNAACRLERTSRQSAMNEADFIHFYPYLPHYVELSIDIMSGIRLQPGALRHLGGSNRTIIKQTYEMLVSERTALAAQPVETLVTLDKIFELVEANLSSEKQKDISDIQQRFPAALGTSGASWETRVAKAICLLEFVRDLPRTEANIAACLVDTVGAPAPLQEVTDALHQLYDAQFVRNTEAGWKLQTAQEKNWETERRSLSPKPKEEDAIIREALGTIFSSKARTYRFRELRTFRIGIHVDGHRVGDEGQIALSLLVADDASEFPTRLTEARNESRQPNHANDIYWVFSRTPEIDDLVQNVYASGQMIAKYNQLRARQRITTQEDACLQNEHTEQKNYETRLQQHLTEAFEQGQGVFRGVTRDASSLGKDLAEIIKKLLDHVVPDLYPKLEMGARQLSGNEAEEVLKAANLNALSQVFYGGDHGLNLVVKEGASYVPNPSADSAKEILDHLRREQAYGNKVTGRSLEDHFQGFGYGWERDILRLVLAVLLRAGTIEVTHQGRRFRNHTDPQCRVPFTNNTAFRSASFAPRESIGIKMLIAAAKHYEELTGEEVDVEESTIATAFKNVADEEDRLLLPMSALVQAHQLPIQDTIRDYRQSLESVLHADSDDAVRILAGEGASFKDIRSQIRALRSALDDKGIAIIQQARTAAYHMWPVLQERRSETELAECADALLSMVASAEGLLHLDQMAERTSTINAAYRECYTDLHTRRADAYGQAIEQVKGLPEWNLLDEAMYATVLAPLTSRAHSDLDLPDGALVCQNSQATVSQMESDLAAWDGLTAQVVKRVRELTMPEEQFERVRVSQFVDGTLDSEEAIEQAVEQLREHLLKLLASGVKIVLE